MAKTPLDMVPFPRQTEKTAARMLRGHRMGALKDGWLIIHEDNKTPPSDDIIDQLCVVRTADHRILIRIVKKGRKRDTWDLLTVTGEQMLDVALVWAEKVTLIVPYQPTPEQVEKLVGVE